MSTTESDNLLIIEAHSIEDVSEVLVALSSVWQAPIWAARFSIGQVTPSRAPWDHRSWKNVIM